MFHFFRQNAKIISIFLTLFAKYLLFFLQNTKNFQFILQSAKIDKYSLLSTIFLVFFLICERRLIKFLNMFLKFLKIYQEFGALN